MSQGRFEDLSGATFGKLTVLYRAEDYVQPSGQHKRMWHCRCACGNECDVRASDLKSGKSTISIDIIAILLLFIHIAPKNK